MCAVAGEYGWEELRYFQWGSGVRSVDPAGHVSEFCERGCCLYGIGEWGVIATGPEQWYGGDASGAYGLGGRAGGVGWRNGHDELL